MVQEQSAKMTVIAKKPVLRGVSHLVGFFVAIVAGAILVSSGPFWGSLIYCLSLIAMFGISAFYHVPNWSPKARIWLRRADHAAIFFLIAGTCTPIALLALSPESARTLLWAIWIAAAAGVLQSMFWVKAPKFLSAFFYLAVGWMCAPYIPEIFTMIPGRAIWLLLLGGITYSVGAGVYAFKKPNPIPGVFGYHEVFHALVIVASAMHFIAIYDLIRAY